MYPHVRNPGKEGHKIVFQLISVEFGLSGWNSAFRSHKFRFYHIGGYRLNRCLTSSSQQISRCASATHRQASHTTGRALAYWKYLQGGLTCSRTCWGGPVDYHREFQTYLPVVNGMLLPLYQDNGAVLFRIKKVVMF